MADIVIAEAVRSAVGRAHKGSLAQRRSDELAGEVIRALLARVPQVKPEDVEDLVLGCAMPEGEQGLNVARAAGFLGGLPQETSAYTVNRFCSSGLQAIALAAGAIAIGSNDIVIAGGLESMTMVPMTGNKLSASPEVMEKYASVYTPMGTTAENVAQRFNISREAQDKFALSSQKKASAAREARRFADEIVTVHGIKYNGNERVLFEYKDDEMIRPDTTLEGLASLKPAFSIKGSVTAGNSSPLSDGAAAAVVLSQAKADKLGIKGLAYFRAFATAGVDPSIMGIGPIPAVRKLFAKTGLSVKDIDIFEVNEAFASVVLSWGKVHEVDWDKVNVNGGAIALGHPVGSTGARLITTALHELERSDKNLALIAMCCGGALATGTIIERI
jgi:acetyl-CoA acyltransferase